MNKDIRLHTDFIHIRKRKKLQQELGCDGLLKRYYKVLTFIEGKWYLNRVVAKSTAVGLTALNREHMRCSLSTVFLCATIFQFFPGRMGGGYLRVWRPSRAVLSTSAYLALFLCAFLTGCAKV